MLHWHFDWIESTRIGSSWSVWDWVDFVVVVHAGMGHWDCWLRVWVDVVRRIDWRVNWTVVVMVVVNVNYSSVIIVRVDISLVLNWLIRYTSPAMSVASFLHFEAHEA